MSDSLIFQVTGGAGKNIMFSAVAEAVRKAHPDKEIVVLASWPETLLHNPNIDKLYRLGATSYFYENHVKGKNATIFAHDPYHTSAFINKEKHLIELWCDLIGVPYNQEKPNLHLTPSEIDIAASKLKPDNRPILLMQTNGGAEQYAPTSWARDLPNHIAQQVVEGVQKDFRVVHVRRDNQPALNGTEYLYLPLRETIACFQFTHRRLLIDSFAQHACAAFNLPSTVCWIANSPQVFGYKLHKNISTVAPKRKIHNVDAVFDEFNISGLPHENPYQTPDLFDPVDLINSLY